MNKNAFLLDVYNGLKNSFEKIKNLKAKKNTNLVKIEIVN